MKNLKKSASTTFSFQNFESLPFGANRINPFLLEVSKLTDDKVLNICNHL